jgi:hypothetical protein
MRFLNESYEEILESDIDLTIGEVFNATIIRPNAVPIDDITKFAWADEDYEEVKIDHKYTEEELEKRNAIPPKTNAELEAENKLLTEQVAALSEQMDFYEECIIEMAMVVYA